jgi:hypothetical protein
MVEAYIRARTAKTATRRQITTGAIEMVRQNEPIRTQKSGASPDEAPIRLLRYFDNQPDLSPEEPDLCGRA